MRIKGLIDYSQPIVAAATLGCVAALIATGIGGYAFYESKAAVDTIEVTGSAKRSVVADYAAWSIQLEAKTGVEDQQAGFDRLAMAVIRIDDYLAGQGFTEVETTAPSAYPEYVYREGAAPIHVGYTVARSVTVRSPDVARVLEIAESIAPLSGPSYRVASQGVELTYQKLAEERVRLLSDAIADARARAESIAREGGRSIGSLRSATGGVVQVLSMGGVEVSDYGMYDTQSMHKDVMVTVRARFELK